MKGTVIHRGALEGAIELADYVIENRHVKLLPASFWRRLPPPDLQAFCWAFARYGIPTLEAVDYLTQLIRGRKAIEIGAGAGDWAYHLGITATDSKIQATQDTQAALLMGGQPPVIYGPNVQQLEAAEAVALHRPEVVIGSWVTQWFDPEKDIVGEAQAFEHGVNELDLLASPWVETYMVVGNMNVHGRKRARRLPHVVLKEPALGLVSRAREPQKNCLFVWNTRP